MIYSLGDDVINFKLNGSDTIVIKSWKDNFFLLKI